MSANGSGRLLRVLMILSVSALAGYGLVSYLNYAAQSNRELASETKQQLIRDIVEDQERARRREREASAGLVGKLSHEQVVLSGLQEASDIEQFRTRFLPEDYRWPSAGSGGEKGVWLQNESQRHRRVLDDRQFDLVVLPVQENSPYFDRVTRLMSARWLANGLAASGDLKVMSPELTLRLLGGRVARFDDLEVSELAKQTGAKVIQLLLSNTARGAAKACTWPLLKRMLTELSISAR